MLNLDQTLTKFVPGSSRIQAQIGRDSVQVGSSNDKRMITATFAITMNGVFLPMLLIYRGKTSRSFPRFKFPNSFTPSASEKHCSNKQESSKQLDDVVIPYVEVERKKLELPTQAILITMNVFKGQMTTPVFQKIMSNNVQLVKVPPNLTHFRTT